MGYEISVYSYMISALSILLSVRQWDRCLLYLPTELTASGMDTGNQDSRQMGLRESQSPVPHREKLEEDLYEWTDKITQTINKTEKEWKVAR